MSMTMKWMRLLGAAAVSLALFGVFRTLAWAESQSPAAVTASRGFKLSGYAQPEYTAQSVGTEGFSMHRARFTLSGDITSKIRLKFQVDLTKSPVLLDAAVEAVFHEAASLRFGQFKVPFSQESLTSGSDLDTIDRAQAVSKLAPGFDIGASGRDIGVVAFGKISFVEYSLGVFNGAGINKADTNDEKDLAGRVVIHPLSVLTLGASYYDGSYSPSAGAAPAVRDRVGFEGALLYEAVSLKAEYLQGEDGETSKRGWYVQAGYSVIPKKLQGLVKFDSYDPDTSLSDNRTDIWLAGFNWFIADKTKLQVNFELVKNEAGTTTNKVLLVQFQAGF
jgi:phosphate-selective porin OprO/OprP